MIPYTLTESDIQLLSNFSGALNAGRALLPPAARFGNIGIPAASDSSPTRNPSIKWSHADDLAALVDRAKGASDYPARLHADKVLTPGAKGYDLVLEPGVVHLFPCAGEGNGGGSQEDGGVGIRGGALSLDPVTGLPPDRVSLKQLPVPGGRAVYPVPVLGGELLGIMIMGDVSRMCRVDIRL